MFGCMSQDQRIKCECMLRVIQRISRVVLNLLGSLIIFFLVLEGGLRLQEPWLKFFQRFDLEYILGYTGTAPRYIFHPQWHHTLTPNYQGLKRLWTGLSYYAPTNAYGFAQSEPVEKSKPKDVFRIFMMGDSWTEGFHPGKKIHEYVSTVLKKQYPDRRFEVINAGVNTHSILSYFTRIRHQILGFSPDVIVLNIDQKDPIEDLKLLPSVEFDADGLPNRIKALFWKRGLWWKRDIFYAWSLKTIPKFLRSVGHDVANIRLAWVILSHYELRRIHSYVQAADNAKDPSIPQRLIEDPEWPLRKALDKDEKVALQRWGGILRNLIAFCKKAGVTLIVTTIPYEKQIYRNAGRHVDNVVGEICKETDTPYFAAYDVMVQHRNKTIYWETDIHFNDLGQKIWGLAVADFVAANMGTSS